MKIVLVFFTQFLSFFASATIGPITGNVSVCVANADTLSDITSGGIWSSSNPSMATVDASGIVTGISAGTATITYTVGGSYQTKTVIVNPLPLPIYGRNIICDGESTTLYDTTDGGGTWFVGSSSGILDGGMVGTNYATVIAGIMFPGGLETGSVVFTDTAGCSTSISISVYSLPFPTIKGDTVIHVGSTAILTSVGGIWSCSNTSIATIGSISGVVTGISAGTATISNELGCIVATTLTVLPPTWISMFSTGETHDVQIFPNPTSTALDIFYCNKITHISISNLLGQTVYTQSPNTNEVQVDVSYMPAGVYFVRINGTEVNKFVKE